MRTANWAQALLRPVRLALVGVSDDPTKISGRPLQFLRAAGFGGEVFIINPARATVQGEKAYASLDALPALPDHVFILTSGDKALDSLEECGRLGIPVATILSAGFSEAGEKGAGNQRRLLEILATRRTRVLGPSSIGLANLHHGLTLTANAAFAEPNLPRGGIFVGSHSGSLIGALVAHGKTKGIGFAGLVSVGGESDLSMGQICACTLDDPNVTSYMLFLETMRHADDLRGFALEAAKRGKPVAAYKLGRSDEAAELAVSHTGSLAGVDEVSDVFLRACGVARVQTFQGLLEVMSLLLQIPASSSARRGRVGVVTTTGGGAAMAVDQLALRGVDIMPPSDDTRAKLEAAGIDAGHGRIVDLTLAGVHYEVMKATLDILRSAPEFDLVLATAGSSSRFNPELAVKPAIDARDEEGCPVAVYLVPDAPQAMRLLSEARVAAFQSPETCADAIAAALHRRLPQLKSLALPPQPDGPDRMLDEAQAYEILTRARIPSAPSVVLDPAQPVPALPFDYPVVAKVLDASIAHKSDAGGVVMGIDNAEKLAAAMQAICASVTQKYAGTVVSRILVQKMVKGVGEVLVGFRRDEQVGPIVVLAAGGVYTELYRDSAMRMAPTDIASAREMVSEIKASRILSGYRGCPKGDIEALAEAIVAVSQLAAFDAPFVQEAEINPVLVLREGDGVIAVDGLVKVREV